MDDPRLASWLRSSATDGLTKKQARFDVYTETVRIDGLHLDGAVYDTDWPVTIDPGAEVLSVNLRFFLAPSEIGSNPQDNGIGLGDPAASLAATLGNLATLDTVSTTEIDDGAVTLAKIEDIPTSTLLGRTTAGDGPVEELTVTTAGLALLDDADAAAQRTTLGLGTAAVEDASAFLAASIDYLEPSQNLADVDSAATSRTNLGLGGAAVLDVGTGTGDVAAGDDSRLIATTKHLGFMRRRLALPELGTTGWTSLTSGTGTSFYANRPQYNAEQRVATILQTHILQVGSAASGTNAIVARQSSLALQWLFDGFRFLVRIFVNATSGISSCRVGMWGNAATPAATGRPGYGLWLEYDPTTLGNGNWWLCCANGGAVTTSDTGIALGTTQRVFVVEQTTTSLGKVWELVTSSSSTQATVASALPSGSVAQDVTAFSQVTRDNAGGTSTKVFIPDFDLLYAYTGVEYDIPA